MNIGEKLKEALTEANLEIDRSRQRRDDLLDAWEKHDWAWLRDAGYLTPAEFERVDQQTRDMRHN